MDEVEKLKNILLQSQKKVTILETMMENRSRTLFILAEETKATQAKADLQIYEEKIYSENINKALLNILDDYVGEKANMENVQRAVINILDDYRDEKTKVDIANNDLIVANKELETFSYSVSHDLRAPIRAINGYSSILQEIYSGKMDSEGLGALQSIKHNSKRMGELIDDLLAFSRLGRKEISVAEINMNALVKSIKEEDTASDSSKIIFTIHDLIPTKGDPSLIKQVWINLISNAIKYSQKKTKTHIEIGSSVKNNFIEYYIKDNGVGFDMQYYEKLFGVFHRLHSQEEFEGTGIGLAIVQKIINRHKGTVWADSKVDEGATFYFSLPIYLDMNKP